MTNTQTGTFLALAGIIVEILAHFSIVIPQDSVVTILAGLVTLYGVIHQMIVTKTVVAAGRAAGAHI